MRYFDGIGGLTTPGAVQESVNHLADTRFGLGNSRPEQKRPNKMGERS